VLPKVFGKLSSDELWAKVGGGHHAAIADDAGESESDRASVVEMADETGQ
jgi:hypothetical protein